MLKLKIFSLLLVSLFISGNLAYAAVNPIVDTMYSSSFGSIKSAVTDTGSSDDDGSHTSTYDGTTYEACTADSIADPATGTDAARKTACASALGVANTAYVSYTTCSNDNGATVKLNCATAYPSCKSATFPKDASVSTDAQALSLCAAMLKTTEAAAKVEPCGDGTKYNCTFSKNCTYPSGTASQISGTTAYAISHSVQMIYDNNSRSDNNLGTLADSCSIDGNPYLYYNCDSSFYTTSAPTCGSGKTLLNCTLNTGTTRYKCDFKVCTAAELNKTPGTSTPTSLLEGTEPKGYCYEVNTDGNRIQKTIYTCKSDYKYTKQSCTVTYGADYTVAKDDSLNSCVWGGAIRNNQDTDIENADILYPHCNIKCPASITFSSDACLSSGDNLNQCIKEGADVTLNKVLNYCGCPIQADGTEGYYAPADCTGGTVAGGQSCTSILTTSLRYERCLPLCSAAGSRTVMDSYASCIKNLNIVNAPLVSATRIATPLSTASSGTSKRVSVGGKCCRVVNGTAVDCIPEPYTVKVDGSCAPDAAFYCTTGYLTKTACNNETTLCCQFNSNNVVINSSCLGEGLFVTDVSTGTCWQGTPITDSFDYCATADKKKDPTCSTDITTQCCGFKGGSAISTDTSCSSSFVIMQESGSCTKTPGGITSTALCYSAEGAKGASFICSCPTDKGYVDSCPGGQTAINTCNYDGTPKYICSGECTAADIAAGYVKDNLSECKIVSTDTPVASICYMSGGVAKQRCACPAGYKTCAEHAGIGTACMYEGREKYASCAGDEGTQLCSEDRLLFDNASACHTTNGAVTTATKCFWNGMEKYMCDCPAGYRACAEGENSGGDSCAVYEAGTTMFERCGNNCRIPTDDQPVVDVAADCPKIGSDDAGTSECLDSSGATRFQCNCPAGYIASPGAGYVGVGDVCKYDGVPKYKSYGAVCPEDRPLFITKDACSFEGIKGINLQSCYLNDSATEDNLRYYCDCPTAYKSKADCSFIGGNMEGAGLMCQLEGQTVDTTKYQFCYPMCNTLPSSGTNNGVIMADDISDNRACAWELGQGAKYEQCSDNHIIKNKCYCGAEYDGRLECLGEDDLMPDIGADKPACIIDGTTYYRACKKRVCQESAVLSDTAVGCSLLLGSGSTATACSKREDGSEAFECQCDTSQYKEICKYPQVEPTGSPYCYASKYDAASNPSPDKQYKSGACKVGAIEKCYQDGDTTNGYMVTVTRSESECRNTLGDGAEARLCEDRNDPDIRRYNCYYSIGDYKWTSSNCPVRHLLTGGSIVVNGVRYYKECNCHPAYQAHRYNCAGILSGGACEQDVTPDNNDGTIPASITKLKFYPYCSCSEDYNQVCDGERMIGVGDPCNGKYKSCECKKDELPANWADNYYGCPGGAKPTGVIKPNGCGGKYYQCEVSQCTWEHTEQCKGDFQIGVDPCQDNQGNIYAYKSCTCPVGWKKCSSSQVGVGKPCSLGGENYYESCTNQDECIKGEYLTCNDSLQIGINPCTKNDKTYFESCACASGYNKKCTDGEIGVGSACVLDGVSYYTECSKPATTCTDAHKDACATNQEKYDPCVTSDNKVKYKCRCPANFTTCAGTTPIEGATVCYDAEKGTVYSGCSGSATCSTDEESVYKTCTKQQIGIGQSCISTDGTTKYAECQDTNDCKANGYQYTCSSYETDALGTDFCVDDKGSKFYKECKCPANYLQCPSKNVKGTPCTPLNADGTYGDTIYSKCECSAQYSETCTGNGQSPGSADDACDSLDEDGEVVTRYKSCVCGDEFNKNCAETGAIPTESSAICMEIKYIGNQMVKTEKYSACGCGEQFKYKCDGTDAGDDAANAGKYTLSGACTTTNDGEAVTKYRSCACGSIYNTVCTSNIQPGADSCSSINADGSRTTKYVAGSCPEPEPEPCVPADCSSYPMTGMAAIVAQCAHSKNYNSCSPGCGQDRKYACLYPKSDLEDKWKYTRENCPEPNELSEGKTFNFAEGVTEIRYQKCKCPADYDKTDAICKSTSASTVAGKDGDIVCSLRSKPVAPSTSTINGTCVDSSYAKVDGCGNTTAYCCEHERAPAFDNECVAKTAPDVVTNSDGTCRWLKTTTTEVTFIPDSCGSVLSLDSSDICTDVDTKEKFGKFCKCDGPSYVESSCPNTTATVCKKSTSTEWEYVKCGS